MTTQENLKGSFQIFFYILVMLGFIWMIFLVNIFFFLNFSLIFDFERMLRLWVFLLIPIIFIVVLSTIIVRLRYRIFSNKDNDKFDREKAFKIIYDFNHKVKPCFFLAIIASIICVILYFLKPFLWVSLFYTLLILGILLNLVLFLYGKVLVLSLSYEEND